MAESFEISASNDARFGLSGRAIRFFGASVSTVDAVVNTLSGDSLRTAVSPSTIAFNRLDCVADGGTTRATRRGDRPCSKKNKNKKIRYRFMFPKVRGTPRIELGTSSRLADGRARLESRAV